ncbi:hypothetical protein ACIRVK_04410 [Streptomyces sp. NPDC101152]|uniref:hypothetical protein n=1 Tax=Streptomyces sp. NPDC101152 TaxID=3366116 RepID=UPI00381E0B61
MADRPSDEARPGSGSGEEPSIPDDVWEKFLKDSERDIHGSAPKEPSARARMVTERLRNQEARGALPEGWRTGPAWQQEKGRRGRRIGGALAVLLAAAVTVVAMKPSLLPGDLFGTRKSAAADASRLPEETAAPTAPPASVDPHVPTLTRPFAGSPAESWADGEAGIVLPKATALGSIPQDRVALALQLTKELLVDANLDPRVLAGARPEAALAVLDPKQPKLLDDLDTALRTPSKAHNPLTLFSRFDPREVKPAGNVVKVRGRITFDKGDFAGVAVHADYTFVYPVVRTDGSTEVTRTIVRRVIDAELPDPAHYRVTPGLLNLVRYDEDGGNTACDIHDGYLHPQFPSKAPTAGATPTGPSVDPYDRSRPIDQSHSCGTVSRT